MTREQEYLLDLIKKPNVAQEDIELALSLMEHEPDSIDVLVDLVVDGAPHLLRQLHRFVGNTGDEDGLLWTSLTDRLTSSRPMSEYDLVWVARLLIDYYPLDHDVADVLHSVYKRTDSTRLVRATILECEHLDYGFDDLKRSVVRDGGHLLESAAALYGLRKLNKAPRNQAYNYAKCHGSHHAVLADIAHAF